MKTKQLLSFLACMGVALSSCNLDNDNDNNNYLSYTLPCSNFIVPASGDAYASAGEYTLTYYANDKISVATSSLDLGKTKPVGFTSSKMTYTPNLYTVNGITKGVNIFKDGSSSSGGVTVQNINGFTTTLMNELLGSDPVNSEYKWPINYTPLVMNYTVDNEYTVKTFMPDAIYSGTTTVIKKGTSEAPFTNDEIRYRIIFNNNYSKADIIFYNANFGFGMPLSVNFILQNLDVEFNKNGYVISGTNVVPSLYSESAPTPAPSFPFGKIEFINSSDDLTTGTLMYSVSVFGSEYDCSFQGHYCLSAPLKQ